MKRNLFTTLILFFFPFPPCYSATFQSLGTSHVLYAYGISGDGSTVVGENYANGISTLDGTKAFRWTQENGIQIIDIVPNSHLNLAQYSSYDGSLIVGTTEDYSRVNIATRWTGRTGSQVLGTIPNYDASQTYGVSGDGSIVVGVVYQFSYSDYFYGAAFRWTPHDGMTTLGSLPGYPSCVGRSISKDGSTIVGYCRTVTSTNTEFTSFIWTEGHGMTDLGLPLNYSATKVSADGSTIAGTFGDPGARAIFKWSATEGLVTIGALPDSTAIEVGGLSGDGSIMVGWSDVGSFIWDSTHGIRILKDALTNQYELDLTGWRLFNAAAISEDGQLITGTGTSPDTMQEVWVANLADNGNVDPGVGDSGNGGGCFITSSSP